MSKRRYNSVKPEVLQNAINLINNKEMSINACSKEFAIPKGTLINKLKNKHSMTVGRPTALSLEEEEVLLKCIVVVANWGFPFSGRDIQMLVKNYLDGQNRNTATFKDNCPGKEWMRRFLKRHKDKLSKRFCQNLKLCKAKISRNDLSNYFEQLKISLTGSDGNLIPSERIFNYDETNLTDDPGVRKFIFKKGVKYPERVLDTTKSSISVMFCGSAAGKLLPPYVVYQATHLWDTWIAGGPARTRYNRTKSGWFDAACFRDWFLELFIPETRHLNGEILIIGDNLSSHFSLDVVEAAAKYNIRFVCLPTNSTHICQPLDVAFYAPLKRKWRSILEAYKTSKKKGSQTIAKNIFPTLLKKLVDDSVNDQLISTNLIAGFAKCGICPLNESKLLEQLPSTSAEIIEPAMGSAVLQMLSNLRGNEDVNDQPKKKRLKLNVVPGKSINPEDFNFEEIIQLENIDPSLPAEAGTSSCNRSSMPTGEVLGEEVTDLLLEDEIIEDEISEGELFALVMEHDQTTN